MKALSIKQPWAWAIIHGGKDIENRTWPTRFRGRFLVHASKTFDMEGWKWIARMEGRLCIQQSIAELPHYKDFLMGGIIGSVEIVGCVRHHGSLWFEGPYGFVLADPRPMEFMLCKGSLGFFDVSAF
ncbi:MAG: ASCH domain-containing protein [Thermodesulfobacteriota bacterium]